MWTRKSPQELANELLTHQMAVGASALLVAYLLIISALPGDVLDITPSARIIAAVSGIMLLGWHWRARASRANAMYCEQCQSVKTGQPQNPCVCGGKLTPLREMKWLDEPDLQTIHQSDSSPVMPPEESIRMSHAV
jgi:hypothetical protein